MTERTKVRGVTALLSVTTWCEFCYGPCWAEPCYPARVEYIFSEIDGTTYQTAKTPCCSQECADAYVVREALAKPKSALGFDLNLRSVAQGFQKTISVAADAFNQLAKSIADMGLKYDRFDDRLAALTNRRILDGMQRDRALRSLLHENRARRPGADLRRGGRTGATEVGGVLLHRVSGCPPGRPGFGRPDGSSGGGAAGVT